VSGAGSQPRIIEKTLGTAPTKPTKPLRIRVVEWNLKEPPIAIETCTVVTGPARFASTTLAQLRAALANPGRWVGWSVPQLIDRLAQVGVTVALEIDKSSELES
jgi:hypothetical protein